MQTYLACSHIDGRSGAIEKFQLLVQQRHPDAILFAGGLFDAHGREASPAATAERCRRNTHMLEHFFSALGATKTVAAVIPGPHDAPLRAFLMAGIHARSEWPGVHLVHCTMVTARDVVILGVGGELTHAEDSGDLVIRCSRTTAEYFLQPFDAADESKKVLLLSSAPRGRLGGSIGNSVAGDLVNSYHPRLCVVGGPGSARGVERVAHTTVVNPGSLSEGSAAWIDWNRDVDAQVEMIDKI